MTATAAEKQSLLMEMTSRVRDAQGRIADMLQHQLEEGEEDRLREIFAVLRGEAS